MNILEKDKETAEIAALKNRITELESLVSFYEEQLRLSKHRQFGASSEKSEHESDQLSLFNEVEVNADVSVAEPELAAVEKHYRKVRRSAGDRLPSDLPVEVVEHELPAEGQVCPDCGGAMHIMGRETRRELKIIPAQVKVVEHKQCVYSCRNCESHSDHTPILKANMPEPVIRGSYASPEAVAHIMCQKFVMGVPLYRQEQEWKRNGILLSRQTMSNWLIRCAEDWLKPIYGRLHSHLCEREVTHGDETTMQVLNEPGKKAQSKSYMWLYRTSGDTEKHIVLYDYQSDRKAIHPKTFMNGFKGYIHADGYEGYHSLPSNFIVVGCWAHARRKFDEALKGLKKEQQKGSTAETGIWYCNLLFRLERKYEKYTAEERYETRMRYSLPLAEDFLLWANSVRVLPKSLVGIAVSYFIGQWQYLKNVFLDGRLELSNNRAERSIKPFVIGRKNWLFSNTPNGASVSSIIYSIIETAKENNLRPFVYLVFLLQNVPNSTTSKLDDFLPWSDSISVSCRSPKADT